MEPMVSATHQRLKRARIEQDLDCKIKNRPGPLELIEGNILKAESFVEQAVKGGFSFSDQPTIPVQLGLSLFSAKKSNFYHSGL